jgi:hypothetical protein
MYFIKKVGFENKMAAHLKERKTMVTQIAACWNNLLGSSWSLSSGFEKKIRKSPCKATSVGPRGSKTECSLFPQSLPMPIMMEPPNHLKIHSTEHHIDVHLYDSCKFYMHHHHL